MIGWLVYKVMDHFIGEGFREAMARYEASIDLALATD